MQQASRDQMRKEHLAEEEQKQRTLQQEQEEHDKAMAANPTQAAAQEALRNASEAKRADAEQSIGAKEAELAAAKRNAEVVERGLTKDPVPPAPSVDIVGTDEVQTGGKDANPKVIVSENEDPGANKSDPLGQARGEPMHSSAGTPSTDTKTVEEEKQENRTQASKDEAVGKVHPRFTKSKKGR